MLPNVYLVFEPFHPNSIYKIGERAGWTIHALLGAEYTRYSYELKDNNFTLLKSGMVDLSSGEATIETRLDHPGMLYLRLSFIGAPPSAGPVTAQELDKITVGAAVAPEQIKLPAACTASAFA
jgi:hypothetical protein